MKKDLKVRAKPSPRKKPFRLRVGMIGVRRDKKLTKPLVLTKDIRLSDWPYRDPKTDATYKETGVSGLYPHDDPEDILSEYKPKGKRGKK